LQVLSLCMKDTEKKIYIIGPRRTSGGSDGNGSPRILRRIQVSDGDPAGGGIRRRGVGMFSRIWDPVLFKIVHCSGAGVCPHRDHRRDFGGPLRRQEGQAEATNQLVR
jgi:hypothetical protein